MSVLALVEELDALIAEATALRARALAEAQATCTHPVEAMVYGEMRTNNHSPDDPDFLVCKDCGLAEEGWGFFDVLQVHYGNKNIPHTPRDDAWKCVRTFRRREEVSESSTAKWRARRDAQGATP